MEAYDASFEPEVPPLGTQAEPETPLEEPEPVLAQAPPAHVEHERLDPLYVKAERASGWIFFLFALSGIVVGVLMAWLSDMQPRIFQGLVAGAVVLTLLLVFQAQFWPRIDYRHRSWSLDGTSVVVKRGVWFRHVISVPRSRIQHTDLSRGPIERRLDLATLIIHTAGNHDFEIRLPGLSLERAAWLRDELLSGQDEDV